ncbi:MULTISPECIES: hypothetical protein, partial [unclassified Blastomonas]|uniref:hypothetical protein n=1 Tax=unclassified Blastomonas TaxID=2626550 RepID=UPI0019227F7E
VGRSDSFDIHVAGDHTACRLFKMAEILAICDYMPLAAMAGQDDRLLGCQIEELAGVVVKPG